ncbi:MAG: hypothetical protein JSV04_12765 [Candidatus Heimdallarchaeota archaeon]|nr:MAG: hypothetical protein JSV04_12765 [Candidatus Heimdallarchaeota archaeon]
MTTIALVRYSWLRLEGLGLIFTALGYGILTQLPPAYFALALLYLDLEEYFIAMAGTILGGGIILGTLSCSLAEDWNESIIPNLRRITTTSFIFSSIFLIGFFLFFLTEPIFPTDFRNLHPTQRYFSAIGLGLALVGVTTFVIYKTRSIFKQ